MVAKDQGKKGLRLFEATGDGVASYALNSALKVYLDGDVIGIRRISGERTEKMRDALSELLLELEGRPYQFNPWTLVKARMGAHGDDDNTALFCSQLIGVALKRMGLLPEETTASNLMPYHFVESPTPFSPDTLEYAVQSCLSHTIIFPSLPTIGAQPKKDVPTSDTEDSLIVSVRITAAENTTDAKGKAYTVRH
jgi:hypothetical protein